MNFIQYLAETDFALDEKRNLNHKVWEETTMKPEIKTALMVVAKQFIEFVDSGELVVVDIVVTGSVANYTWHDQSDIDLHIMADLSRADNKEMALELFNAKKAIWNSEHDVKIKGFPVELYVQDEKEDHVSSGVYSIQRNKWIVKPKKTNPSIDDSYVVSKANTWKSSIDGFIKNKSCNLTALEKLKARLREMRKMGLDRDGEFSVENLAFKILRRDKYIEKLYDYASTVQDKQLSLESYDGTE
jgi:predicted nucleotidyltransferase